MCRERAGQEQGSQPPVVVSSEGTGLRGKLAVLNLWVTTFTGVTTVIHNGGKITVLRQQ